MELKYVGPMTFDGSPPPLPQGWPAVDHDEPDEEIAQQKLDFRVKRGQVVDGRSEFIQGEAAYEQANPPAKATKASEKGNE